MKSFGGLFDRIIAPENLRAAMLRAAQGKRHRSAVVSFLSNTETELDRLREEVASGTYRPRPYMQFRIKDPKPRMISCADFRDRIMHQSLCAVIGSCLERRFIADTYACRTGKGCHRAVLRAQELTRRHKFYLKLDVAKYYDSIRHDILLSLLGRMFREVKLRNLIETVVCHPLPGQRDGCGVPIGNLTSQWFGNFYLDGLDHWATECSGAGGYCRYMDDIVFWDDCKERLWRIRGAVEERLVQTRGLAIKATCLPPTPVTEGLPFLGMRIYPERLRLQQARMRRSRRHIAGMARQVENGWAEIDDLIACERACLGIVRFFGLRGVPISA
jgi:hypothetical protein